MIEELRKNDEIRVNFLKACLIKLGLHVSSEQHSVPSLSRLHLSSLIPSQASEVVASLDDIITTEDGEDYIKDDNDTFLIENPSAWSCGSHDFNAREEKLTDNDTNEDRVLNYSTILKRIVVHDQGYPESKETPYFNHHAFFSNLKHYQLQSSEDSETFGEHILYGEVVTSTNTILEKYGRITICGWCEHYLMFLEIRNCFEDFPWGSQRLRQCKLLGEGVAPTSGSLLLDA